MDNKKVETIKSQDFGIEIEVEGITREQAAKAIAEYFGKSAQYIGNEIGYGAWGFKDNEGRLWKCVEDSSLANYGCEVVSPICYYKDIQIIEDIVDIIKGLGATVSYRTGIHVHIGAQKMNAIQLRNLINSFSNHEDMVFRALKVDYDREIDYCKKTNKKFLRILNYEKPDTKTRFFDIWYETLSSRDSREEHYNISRYHAVNFHSTYTKGTIEFRLFNSTLNKKKVSSYIIFCMALIAQAVEARRVSTKKVESDNEKYSMRTWLRQLGLNGVEFKVLRKVFLEKLHGNVSYR